MALEAVFYSIIFSLNAVKMFDRICKKHTRQGRIQSNEPYQFKESTDSETFRKLSLAYKEIALCWIPSHIGIQGNEMVDMQAKTSLSLEPTSFKISFSNFKPSINKYILAEWQTSWNNSIGNKFLDIKPTIGEYQSVVRNIRKEEAVLARLRLGHTRVTHSYLLQGEEQPQCVGCDTPFTVRHFLLECGNFAQVRNNCFHVDNMKELFQDIHIDSIMAFYDK